jgi:hypothetical protein
LNNAYKKKNFHGYDVVADNAKTDPQMCIPMLSSRFGPKIKTNCKQKLKKKNNKIVMDLHVMYKSNKY